MTSISDDCPHRQQLEHTLLHCQTQSEMLQATRDNYLSIIVEFQRDLEELTDQVEQQQKQQQQQLQHNELVAEESEQEIVTHELELQNERLIYSSSKSAKCTGGSGRKIQELHTVVNGYADISETNRLKDEISALKQRNTEQAQKVCEIARLLKKQEEERQKLCRNYENLMNTSDDQCKELRRANREVQGLQDRLSQVEKTQEELRTERNLLREEIVALKEKEARSTGRERALNDQLKCRQQELEKSRILLRDMHNHLKQEERQHKDTVARLCQANEEVRLQLQAVSCECKEMQLKLKQQTSVTEQQQLIIESFRKWKDAQLRSDEVMRQCIKRAEEHINALLDENQHLTEEYRRLYGDYCVLEIEMRRIKNAVNIRLPSGSAEQPEVVLRGQKVHEEMINRMRYMRMTSQRLSDQVKVLNASPRDLHTPTTYRSTPTTISEQQQHQQQLEQQQQQQQQQQQSQQQQQQQQLTLSKNAWQLHRPN